MRTSIIAVLAGFASVHAELTGAYIQRKYGGMVRFLSPDGEPEEGTPVTLTDRDSAVTWRWDENDPGLLFPRVDGSDLCLSTTDEIVETGRQIVLAKCPSLPWEFSYFVSKAFRIKSRGLLYCVDVSGPNRTVVLKVCAGKYSDKTKYQDFIWQCPDDVEPDW